MRRKNNMEARFTAYNRQSRAILSTKQRAFAVPLPAKFAFEHCRRPKEREFMRFMRQPQKDGGWVLNYDYLNHVQSVMNDEEIGIVELETIEAVLLAAEKVEAQTQTGNT